MAHTADARVALVSSRSMVLIWFCFRTQILQRSLSGDPTQNSNYLYNVTDVNDSGNYSHELHRSNNMQKY